MKQPLNVVDVTYAQTGALAWERTLDFFKKNLK